MSSQLASPAERRGTTSDDPVPPEPSHSPADPWGAIAPDPFGGGLRLVPMSHGSWRLCDGDAPADDASSVLAYIEQDQFGIGVVWLQGPSRHDHYPSIEDAIAAAQRLTASTARLRSRSAGPSRPIPIPHFSPPRAN